MNHEITASWTSLMKQAPDTVEVYLQRAKEAIDESFGPGYAAKHPKLVSAFIQASAIEFQTAGIGVAAQQLAYAIEKGRMK